MKELSMSTEKHRIMVVDDESVNLSIMEKYLLDEGYEILLVNSGEECLEKLDSFRPEVILLDIIMPGIDGYEVASRIVNHEEHKNIHIIFVSAKDTLEDRIKGYAYGASDYFVKPFQKNELLIKIDKFINFVESVNSIDENAKNATEIAMKAMTNASEIGLILRFLQESFLIDSLQDLALRLLETTTNLGLECTVQLRRDNEVLTITEQGVFSPLEETILTKAKDKGRIYDIKDKTLVNYETVSLFIKNMPVDNEVRYGEIKDFICYLLDGVEARVNNLNNEIKLAEQKENLRDIIHCASVSFEQLNANMHQLRLAGAAVVEDMMDRMDDLVPRLGLEEGQEIALLDITERGVQQTTELFSSHLKVDSKFVALISQLQNVYENKDIESTSSPQPELKQQAS
jgi:CheY-like chemotaxis protein